MNNVRRRLDKMPGSTKLRTSQDLGSLPNIPGSHSSTSSGPGLAMLTLQSGNVTEGSVDTAKLTRSKLARVTIAVYSQQRGKWHRLAA